MNTISWFKTAFLLCLVLLVMNGSLTVYAKPPKPDDPVWFNLEQVIELKRYKRHLNAFEVNEGFITKVKNLSADQATTGFSAIIYYGSWCADSSRELPRLYKLMQALGGTLEIVPIDKKKNPLSGQSKPVSRFSVPRMHFYFNGELIGVREVSMGGKPAKGLLKMLQKHLKK